MKSRLIILFAISISPTITRSLSEIEKTNTIMAAMGKWIQACSKQDDAKKNVINGDLQKEKQIKKELEDAKKYEEEKRIELKKVLKEHCPNRASKILRYVKELEATNRENNYNSDNPTIYKCTKNIEDEIKRCSCNQPTLWGKMQNIFSHK